jgi:hypothetical protein
MIADEASSMMVIWVKLQDLSVRRVIEGSKRFSVHSSRAFVIHK